MNVRRWSARRLGHAFRESELSTGVFGPELERELFAQCPERFALVWLENFDGGNCLCHSRTLELEAADLLAKFSLTARRAASA